VEIAQESISGLPLATATAWANEAELLKPYNAAVSSAITSLWQQSASGIEKANGDYFVSYALDSRLDGSKHNLKKLIGGDDNQRLEVMVRDSRTGRIIPGLRPECTLVAPDGKLYGPSEMLLTWHPWLTLYGRAERIPRKDAYKLRVHFDAPGFRRWGRQSERFASPADIEFGDVTLESGKPSTAGKNPELTPEQKD